MQRKLNTFFNRFHMAEIKLNYIEKGTGEPFIMLHGNGEDSSYFTKQIEYFSQTYRVIALDTRGHGKSERGDTPFSIHQFSIDLYDFMKDLEISKAIILGFSDGANIAMDFAISHQNMIRALILNGGNIYSRGVKRIVQFPIEIGYRIASLFASVNRKAKMNAEMLGLMVNDLNIHKEDLAKITVPTLVIAGTNDMIKENHTREIASIIPDSELIFIKGNHFIANNKPYEFNMAVEGFLKRLN